MRATPYKILVVDDLPDWRTTLSGLLEDEGYAIQVAGSSADALALLANGHFDLILSDMRLDETDEDNTEGLDLVAEIQQRWPKIKTIIITGYGTPDTLRRAMQPNTQGQKLTANYITKSETEELVKMVREVLAQ